ncbi:hypothetical protein ACLB1S_27980 [Escherichia coli]
MALFLEGYLEYFTCFFSALFVQNVVFKSTLAAIAAAFALSALLPAAMAAKGDRTYC